MATGCGDAPKSRSPAPAASADPSWREYFPPRAGHECTFATTFEAPSLRVVGRQTQTVSSIHREADGQHVVIRTRSVTTVPGSRPVSITIDNPYIFANDGTLRAAAGLATTAALRVRYHGFQVLPSVPDLRRGRSAHSKVSLSVSGMTGALRRALVSLGARGSFKADLEYDARAAPSRRAIVTPAGRYTDVIGVAIKLTAFHLRNARNDVDAATQEGLRGLLGNGATSYYAKDVGLVLSEASGSAGTTTVRLRGCAGS